MVMNGRLQHHQSAATGISGSKTKRKPFPGVFRERASGLHGADTVDGEIVNCYGVTFEMKEWCHIKKKNEY